MTRAQPKPKPPNLLRDSGLPLAYPTSARLAVERSVEWPTTLRTSVRSLTVMQKEAIVARSDSPVVWRLASDEGPYLQGHDFAPAPLAVLTTGMAVDLLLGIERGLAAAELQASPLTVTLDTRFTMEGSLPKGTMVGGALPPAITVATPHGDLAAAAVLTGVMSSATAGLTVAPHRATFTLTSHGVPTETTGLPLPDIAAPSATAIPDRFPRAVAAETDQIITKTVDVGEHTTDAGVSLQPEQRRELHLHADARRRPDGLVAVDTAVHRPQGSTFRFLSDEPMERVGQSRAPDALTYLSAGLGFCFMTQLGRYAKIMRRSLGDYRIMQDTKFAFGRPGSGQTAGGRAAAPITHVYLEPDDGEFAADAVAMSEQTCFVHAMCRTPLRPRVRTVRRS